MSGTYKVLIIGAGLAGVGMAARLKDAGEESFVILERASGPGGTWRDNTYPGCGCDVPSNLYWYSFDDNPPPWSRVFARQEEILSGIRSFVSRKGIERHTSYGTEVASAHWDDDELSWTVTTTTGEVFTADVLVSAVGQLSRPSYRGIAGREQFEGISFHSAQWRSEVDLTGKRVACIGSGASAAQLIPELAKVASHLTVFQRTAPYVLPRNDRPYTDVERSQFRNQPEIRDQSRAEFYAWRESLFDVLIPGSDVAKATETLALEHLNEQVQDEELRKRLTPDYTIGCKRPVQSDDLLATFTRDNVELVTHGVTEILATGPIDDAGDLHEVDVIVYSTGFDSLNFLDGLDIQGVEGVRLHEDAWKEAAEAYQGMNVAGFPNFFILYGPNTNLNHNSIISMLEVQYEFVIQAIAALEGPVAALDVDREVQVEYNNHLQQQLQASVFASGCQSWYRNSTGRIVTNWWGSVEDYRAKAGTLNLNDFRTLLREQSGQRVLSPSSGS